MTAYNTTIKDFQAQVVNADVGVLRGYLANADKVRVRGVEFDGQARIGRRAAVYTAVAYTDGIYVSFPDAPPPLSAAFASSETSPLRSCALTRNRTSESPSQPTSASTSHSSTRRGPKRRPGRRSRGA